MHGGCCGYFQRGINQRLLCSFVVVDTDLSSVFPSARTCLFRPVELCCSGGV